MCLMKVDKFDPLLMIENMKEMGHAGSNLILLALPLHTEHFLLVISSENTLKDCSQFRSLSFFYKRLNLIQYPRFGNVVVNLCQNKENELQW